MQRIDFDSSTSILGTIKGKPFQAEYEHIVKKGSMDPALTGTITGRVYRDSSGRTRKDVHRELAPGLSIDIAYIYDPNTKRSYLLDLNQKEVVEDTISAQPSFPKASSLTLQPRELSGELRDSDLGESTLEGIACHGYRVSETENAILEFWVSSDLSVVLLEQKRGKHEESTRRLFNIKLTEPDKSLFVVPAGFKNR